MRNSTLIFIFKRLSNQEIAGFRKFLDSPYHNKRVDIKALSAYIETKIKKSQGAKIDRAEAFKKVYGAIPFDDKKLRHTISVLLQLLKKFLVLRELESDNFQNQKYLCEVYRSKGMKNLLEKEIRKTHEFLDDDTKRDSNFYLQKYKLWTEALEITTPKNRSQANQFSADVDQLSIAYVSNILHLSCNIQSLQTMSKNVDELSLLHEVLATVEKGKYQNIPAVSIYYNCYRAFEFLGKNEIELSEQYFQTTKELILAHWHLFSDREIKDIYLLAINYCIKRLNSGARNFIREAFELFKSGLENESILENGVLSNFTYKNITRLGIALEEKEWVEQFLAEYKIKLHPADRDDAWRYNQAFVYFDSQQYKSAMQLLILIDFKDVLNNLDARRMLLKSYFELGEYDALDSLLESFTRYIQRQKDLGYHKENYLNLIKFTKRITHFDWKNKLAKTELIENIKMTTQLAERKWLLEKVNLRQSSFN